MYKYIIRGGNPLCGTAGVQGAKNAVLPILAASVIPEGITTLHNCPDIYDVKITLEILRLMGCNVQRSGNSITVDASSVSTHKIPEKLTRKMRSSVIFLGAILAREGVAVCSYPGGCELGLRPIDIHLKAFRQLGVEIAEEDGFIKCRLSKYRPGYVHLGFPSVGATENLMLLACRQSGKTVITNCAREPEITDLQDFLNSMGARISGAGSSIIEIEGVPRLHPAEKTIMSDRIVAATLMFMVAATKGELELENVVPLHISSIISLLRECGADIRCEKDKLKIKCTNRLHSVANVQTMPYPGFPTDAQSQLMAALTTMHGTSIIDETIFENRFNTATELMKMGADITVKDRIAVIRGVESLHPANVTAPDLRGGAALVIAALATEGKTEIGNVCYIERGYENFDLLISSVGGKIIKSQ
ncbi:MAG: UDP-N-acetylglucosamine 1-carboxyvinyltransferase [Clostridia bacterium]|nr:UDP-N-acetylglucosamine 1-carboxyvinyltransferase [Clostridia bacterium]